MFAGVAHAACECLAPLANKWAGCAIAALPGPAYRQAVRYWELGNDDAVYGSHRRDRAGEARWIAKWRGMLRRKCGSLEVVKKEKFKEGEYIPSAELDEIYAIVFYDNDGPR